MIASLESHLRGGVPLCQLRLTVKWSKPPIWRRVGYGAVWNGGNQRPVEATQGLKIHRRLNPKSP